jgi:hypothetical protein
MSKAIPLGKKLGDMISVSAMRPDEAHYPTIYIDDVDDRRLAQMPDTGEATIKYRIKSRTHREEKKDKGKEHSCSLCLEIVSINPPPSTKKKNNGYGDDARRSFADYFKDKK